MNLSPLTPDRISKKIQNLLFLLNLFDYYGKKNIK